MEDMVHDFRSLGKNVSANLFEVHIVKLQVDEKLLLVDGPRPRIDPVRWRPLIMSFCRFFGAGRRGPSLAPCGIRFHEDHDPGNGGATGECAWRPLRF
jgi:hypothetical protein